MNMPMREYHGRQSGFTLLEVLVAVLVLAVGVIGMAGLQFASLRNNSQSLQRSQAAALASELADLMRANRVVAGAGSYLLPVTTTVAPPTTNCAASGTNCSGAQMASYDLYQWQTLVLAALPGAKTRVECPNGSATACTRGSTQIITVMWDENRTGATTTGCGSNDLSCYKLSLTP